MSAYGLQQATAFLIRRPESYRGAELPAFLDRFDLTAHERMQATHMANDPAVAKYGRIMGSARERKVTSLLRQSQHYLPEGLLSRVWKDYFEPAAIYTKFNQLPLAFLKFLIEDENAVEALKTEAPPFIPDMLRFEIGLAHFRMKHYSDQKKIPEGSLLKHPDFVLMELDYDIQGLRARLIREKVEPGSLSPEQRRVKLLFIRKDTSWDARIFEIDDETYSFLQGQLQTPPAGEKPKSYENLVKLGLLL